MRLQIEKGFARVFYDSLLCVAIYILAVSLPAPPFMDQTSFTGALRFLVLAPIGLILAHDGLSLELGKTKKAWLCIPILFIAFGNMISLLLSGGFNAPDSNEMTKAVLFTLGTATVEEIVFRVGLIGALQHTSWKKADILVSSLIFGLCHALGILAGGAILPSLAQAGYTFLLGLLVGVAFKVGGILPAIGIHFFFNFLQNDLYLGMGGGKWDIPFFAWNIGCFLVAAAVAFLLYWKRLRKN